MRQVALAGEADLHDDVDQLLFHEAGRGGNVIGPRVRTATFHLTPLHRQIDLDAAGIADHQLEPGAENVVVKRGELDGDRAGAGRADQSLSAARIREGLGR